MLDSTQEASAVKRRRFASAPWTEDSAERQRCDQQVSVDHVARRIAEALERLDLGPRYASYSGRGTAAVMLAVALIEKRLGRQSPGEWFRDLRENIVRQWAGFGIRPSRSVCYEFCDRLGPLLDLWNKAVVGQAIDAGVTDAAEGTIDGTTIAACASRHRLLDEERLTARVKTLGLACEQDGRREPVEKKGPAWQAPPTAAERSDRTS